MNHCQVTLNTDQTLKQRPAAMASPCKNATNVERHENTFDSMKNKEFKEIAISQIERLRMKNSDEIPVPVTMSQIT